MTATPYPYSKPTTMTVPFRTIVQRADPDFQRAKKFEPYYVFANGRIFTGDNGTTGAYDGSN
jgi:hypothetical protein